MQDDKKEKPKDEKKKKNKYNVKDGDGNIMDVEVPESWIKILEAMNKGEKKKWIPFLKEYCSNIEYVLKFLGKIKKALKFQCLYRSFYFHWLKQSGWSLFTLDWVGCVFSLFILGVREMLFFLILMDISLITIKNEWNKNADNNTAIDKDI